MSIIERLLGLPDIVIALAGAPGLTAGAFCALTSGTHPLIMALAAYITGIGIAVTIRHLRQKLPHKP
jgi:hypothetical protein